MEWAIVIMAFLMYIFCAGGAGYSAATHNRKNFWIYLAKSVLYLLLMFTILLSII